ncbi:diguanylate cyclase [Actinotalea sp. AC32]|nr:diguanylate cyclase [Actinotalea sp. AC32]
MTSVRRPVSTDAAGDEARDAAPAVLPSPARPAPAEASVVAPDGSAEAHHVAPDALTETPEDELARLVDLVERTAGGRPGDVLPHAERALALAQRLGDRLAEVRVTYFIGYAHRLLSRDVEALSAMERSLALAQEIGDRVWEASAICGLGTVHAGFGDLESAIELQERSLAIRQEIEDQFGVAVSLNNLGLSLLEVGLFPDRARELLDESRRVFATTGHRHCQADSLLHLATLDLAEADQVAPSDPELAHALAGAAVRSAEQAVDHARSGEPNPRLLAESLVRLAGALLACGRLDDADTHLREAASVAEGLEVPQVALHVVLTRGRLHRLRGELDQAVAELVAGLAAADTLVRGSERVRLLGELVAAHEVRGDLASALAAHRELLTATLAHRDESAERRAHALNAQRDLERAELTAEMERLKAEQLELANRVLAHEAAHDPLTGLANRRSFDQAIKARTAAPDARLTCLIGDLDHFKHVNDRYSHLVGDEVLRQVAQVVSAAVRGTDLVARFGGEEIAVLLADSDDPGTTARVCTRIRDSLAAHPWDDIAPGLRVTISIGAATRRPGEPADSVLARADHLMYQAKTTGRDRAVLDEP